MHYKRKSSNIERKEQIHKAIIAYQNKKFDNIYAAAYYYNINYYILAKRVAEKNSKV